MFLMNFCMCMLIRCLCIERFGAPFSLALDKDQERSLRSLVAVLQQNGLETKVEVYSLLFSAIFSPFSAIFPYFLLFSLISPYFLVFFPIF